MINRDNRDGKNGSRNITGTLWGTGEIQQLTLSRRVEYCPHFNLKGKNNDKSRRIICHASNKQGDEINAYIATRQDPVMRTVIRDNEISDSEEESDSEDDLVISHYSSAESSQSETKEEDLVPVVQLLRQTRPGRSLGTPFSPHTVTVFCMSSKLPRIKC